MTRTVYQATGSSNRKCSSVAPILLMMSLKTLIELNPFYFTYSVQFIILHSNASYIMENNLRLKMNATKCN